MVHVLWSGANLMAADIEHELNSPSSRYGRLVPDHQLAAALKSSTSTTTRHKYENGVFAVR
jgi:hypothetical protein